MIRAQSYDNKPFAIIGYLIYDNNQVEFYGQNRANRIFLSLKKFRSRRLANVWGKSLIGFTVFPQYDY